MKKEIVLSCHQFYVFAYRRKSERRGFYVSVLSTEFKISVSVCRADHVNDENVVYAKLESRRNDVRK